MSSGPRNDPDASGRRAAKRELILSLLKKEGLARRAVQEISPRKGSGPAPLSFAQERLWFLDQLQSGNSVYNIRRAYRLSGSLDVAWLTRALNQVVGRHEILRTTFPAEDGSPIQRIVAPSQVAIPVVDLQKMARSAAQAEAFRIAQEEAEAHFNLAHGPLWRIRLIRLGKADHVLLFTVHQILLDGGSLGLFFREIETLYASYHSGQPAELADLPVQYADFSLWQRDWLQGGELEKQLAYWKGRLGGMLPALELPADRPRPGVQTLRGARHGFVLEKSMTGALKQLSRKEGVTLFAALMAAFNVLLYRYTGQEDIIVGFPIANRNRSEIQSSLGFFVNTLALRTDLSDNPTFRTLLARVGRACREAYAHQDLPFERLVDELGHERDLSRNPLFQVMFAFHNTLPAGLHLPGLRSQAMALNSATSKFDLTLSLGEENGRLTGFFEYSTDLFERSTIERMAGHFQTLLRGVAADCECAISTLPLLTEAEQSQILVQWNDTTARYRRGLCMHHLFEAQVKRTPHAAAVECGGERLTYRELNRRANQLARYLRKLGAGPERLVGVCLERSLAMVIGLLGVLKSGAAYVPLDPKYPLERLAFMVADARVGAVLTQKKFAHGAESLVNRRLPDGKLKVVCMDAERKQIAKETSRSFSCKVRSHNLAYVIYTSGSTGQPKGVGIEHKNVAAFLHWAGSVFSPAELSGVLASTSICFDLSIFELFAPLSAGGKVILVQNALALADVRERTDITLINTVPSAMNELLAAGRLPRAVRTVNLAGEPLKSELVRKLYATGTVEKVYDLYGPSETTTYSTFTLRAADGRASIGRPIANTQIYLLDAAFQPVPVGVPGELFIGGAGVARGYLHCPDLTAEKFLPNPFVKRRGARMYRTGDRARYLADGNIEYLGRADNQVKVRGYRIEPGEIEAALAEHPSVGQVVVAARELNAARPTGPSSAQLEKQLIAYLVPKNSILPAASELRNFLRAKLPEFMMPAIFLPMAALPLTPNGKVDRLALPTPDSGAGRGSGEFVAPRSEIEELIAQVWRETLGMEQIGLFDSFFALGGHSLLATKLVLRLRAAFQIELPLRKLFESPTVAALAEAIEALRRDRSCVSLPPLSAAPRTNTAPLSFSQRRLWFLHKLDPDLTAYNMPAAYRIEGPLNIGFFKRALDAIIERHEPLRSAIVEIDGEPQQRIAPEAHLPLPVIDLTSLAAEQAEREVERLATEEAERPFDLAAAPLLRAAILRLAGDVHVVLLNFHHIICDGSSLAIFYRELAALYDALLEGREPALAPLAVQYRDFAAWQHRLLQHGRLQAQLDYWRRQLGGGLTFVDLPADWQRPAVQNYRGARVTRRLTPELTAALKQLAGKAQVTLFMILLAALKILLSRLTGQNQIVVGSTLAGRNRAELEGLIGFFINAVALRSDLSGNPVFVELLRRVREVCIEAYTHQDLPFERMVEELNPQRDLSRHPVFQILFNMAEIGERELQLPGCTATRVSRAAPGAKFDLVVHAPQIDGALELVLVFNADLFDESTMRAMLESWNYLLSQIVDDPARRIGEFSLVGDAAQVVLPNPAEPLDDSWHGPIHSWIARQAKARRQKEAVVDERESWSYRELDRLGNRLAQRLIEGGIRRKDVVAIYAHRDASLALALIGVLKAGGAFLILDPAYPAARLLDHIRMAQPTGMIQMEGAGQVPAAIEAYVGETRMAARVKLPRAKANITRCLARLPRGRPEVAIGADDPAYVAFTSGSTGEPKGVLCRHGPITHFLPWQTEAFGLKESDRYGLLSGLGYNHLHRDLFTALALGATLCVPSDDDLKDPSRLARWLDRHEVSILHLTPALGRFLQTAGGHALAAVRRVFFGGDLLLRQDILGMRALAPNAQFTSFYGATETQRAVGYFNLPDSLLDARNRARQALPSGKGAPNVQLLLLTPNGQLAGIGEIGELYVRSPHLAAGYVGDGSPGEVNFITNPFTDNPRDRLYRTRELARYLPDGSVEWLGRNRRRASIRGFRVELAEVESALRQCSGVRQAAVMAEEFPLDEPSRKEARLVAYVALDKDGANDASRLREWVSGKLPSYMVPSYFRFVERMPLNPSGKIDYDLLPQAGQPLARAESFIEEPRGELERAVGKIFAEILQIERIGRQDDFFALGGHSLLAARAAARLRQSLGLELDLRDFLEFPTVEAICRRTEAQRKASQSGDRLQGEQEREEIEL